MLNVNMLKVVAQIKLQCSSEYYYQNKDKNAILFRYTTEESQAELESPREKYQFQWSVGVTLRKQRQNGCKFLVTGGHAQKQSQEVVAHSFNPSTPGAEATLQVPGQPGLQSSQGYKEKPRLENQNKQGNQKRNDHKGHLESSPLHLKEPTTGAHLEQQHCRLRPASETLSS